jgi:large subunit ribosomal protein L9
MKSSHFRFPRRVRIHGGECGAVARALHHEAQKNALIPYEQVKSSLISDERASVRQADLGNVLGSTLNESNLKQHEEKLKVIAKKEAAMLAELNKVIDILKSSPVKVTAKTGTSGKIFGSVTSLQIARAIRDQKGYEIDRKRITISEDVKELGTHKVSIDFGNSNVVEIDFEVVGE